MMLHDKVMPGQFMFDMKNECRNAFMNTGNISPVDKLNTYAAYSYRQHQLGLQQQHELEQHRQQQEQQQEATSAVLDLSRRCDSVETRKTPSPYNSTSSLGADSPSIHSNSPSTSALSNTPLTSPHLQTTNDGLLHTKLGFTPATHDFSPIYPMAYHPAAVKKEIISPPPLPTASLLTTPLPLFPPTPAAILQQTYATSRLDEQNSLNAPSANLLYPNILNAATTGSTNVGKAPRPFNAYPRDPDLVTAHFKAADRLISPGSIDYNTFRKRFLDDLHGINGGHRTVSNPKMRRTNTRNSRNSESEEIAIESSDNDSQCADQSNKNDTNNNTNATSTTTSSSNITSNAGTVKDEAYYERRRKNNAAAKKSRDRRRIKEDEIAIRAAYLERQNIELLCQIDTLKKQLEIFTKG